MIRRLFVVLVAFGLWFGYIAEAADLPSVVAKPAPYRLRAVVKPKLVTSKPRKVAVVQQRRVDALPAPVQQQVVASRQVDDEASGVEIGMSWVLEPLFANADGGKKEGSASVEGNIVVVEPGYVSLPYMVVELTGHIIKTAQTTARLDVKIGDMRRTVSWTPEDVQSGKFRIELQLPMREGKLPAYFPVSALAFATKDGKDGVAMVSLEKIEVRVGKVRLAGAE